MKYPLLLAAFLLSGLLSNAQVQLLSTTSRTARAQVDLAAGEMSKNTDEGEPSHFESLQLSISHGELIVSYELAEPAEKGYFEMKGFQVLLDGQVLDLAPEQIIGETGRISAGGRKNLVVAELLERFINLRGNLTVTLTIASYGERKLPFNIDCNTPPSFTTKQRMPYYLAAAGSVACIGMGQYFRIRSEDVYENQYKQALTGEEAAPLYKDANGKHHTYLVLTYGGSALLAADIVLYLLRNRNYKKKLALYQEYCSGTSLLLEPVIEMPSLRNQDGQAGMKLTVNF